MDHDIFISYSSKDKQTADAICHVLEENRLKCWMAPRDIIAGKNYAEQIVRGIKFAKIIVLVFSKNSQESVFVTNEIDTAFCNNKSIISFKIDETMPENKMEFFLKNKHWLDAYPKPEKVFGKLVRDAHVLCKEKRDKEYSKPNPFYDQYFDQDSIVEEKLNSNKDTVIVEIEEDSGRSVGDVDVVEDSGRSVGDVDVVEDSGRSVADVDVVEDSGRSVGNVAGVDDSNESQSDFSKYKIPIIVAIVALILIVGFVVFSGNSDVNSNNEDVAEEGIVIDYIDVDDDGESYFVFGSIPDELKNSSKSVIHVKYFDEKGDVIKTDKVKLEDVDSSILDKCLVGKKKVVNVSVELYDVNGSLISSAESNNIK